MSGSYRKMMQGPIDLTWKVLRYNVKDADLIISDVDELRDIKPLENDPGKFSEYFIKFFTEERYIFFFGF